MNETKGFEMSNTKQQIDAIKLEIATIDKNYHKVRDQKLEEIKTLAVPENIGVYVPSDTYGQGMYLTIGEYYWYGSDDSTGTPEWVSSSNVC